MESFNIGRTLSRTFSLVFSTLPSVGVFVLVVQIASVALQFLVRQFLTAGITTAQASGNPMAALAIFSSGWYWLSMAASLALGSLCFAGSIHGFLKAADQEPTSLADCFGVGVAKLLPVLALTLLWYLGVGLGWMLLLVPGLILMVMWSVAMPALVGEDLNVIASFGRSRELTKGSRIMIFLTLLIFLVVIYVVLFAILGAMIGGSIMGMARAVQTNPWLSFVSIPSGWLFGMLTGSLLTSIYLETVMIKSGGTQGQLTEVFS